MSAASRARRLEWMLLHSAPLRALAAPLLAGPHRAQHHAGHVSASQPRSLRSSAGTRTGRLWAHLRGRERAGAEQVSGGRKRPVAAQPPGRRQRLGAVMGPARGGQTRTRVCAHLRALARCAGLIQPTKACCTLSLRRQHQGRSAAFGCVMVLSTEGCRRVGERTGESKEGGCRLGTGGGFTGDAAAHGDRRSVCCVGSRVSKLNEMFVGEFAG